MDRTVEGQTGHNGRENREKRVKKIPQARTETRFAKAQLHNLLLTLNEGYN